MEKPLSVNQLVKLKGYNPQHIRRLLRGGKLKGYRGEKIGRKWIIYECPMEQDTVDIQDDIKKTILTERLKEHWDKLAELAGRVFDTWADPDVHESSLNSKGEFIFSDEDHEETNWMLAEDLVWHLKKEFKEFRNVKKFRDLLSANLIKGDVKLKALEKLDLVRNRKTFKGKCPIYRSC